MNKQTTTAQAAALQVADPESGEMRDVLYFKGTPRQYRFDGNKGEFSLHGKKVLGNTFKFHPLAWRIFDDALFGRALAKWAEFFFVDEEGCLSTIMFNNSSVTELMDVVPQLGYDRKELSDVVLKIKTDRLTNDKGTWFVAKFDYEDAPKPAVKAVKAFAAARPIYREDTITPNAEYRFWSDTYAMNTAQAIALGKGEIVHELPAAQAA